MTDQIYLAECQLPMSKCATWINGRKSKELITHKTRNSLKLTTAYFPCTNTLLNVPCIFYFQEHSNSTFFLEGMRD
uniref:Uncharacterized protein n=1 Tax=Anguilla anguilla TaxID=7936 RepID=A0A0E9WTW4_ANGAN